MTRIFAILGAAFCLGMMVLASATENVRGELDRQTMILHAASLFLFAMSFVLYCGFAALHSVSHVEDPRHRVVWILYTVGFNVFGSLIYYLTKYQDFKACGKGALIRRRKLKENSFWNFPRNGRQVGEAMKPGPRRGRRCGAGRSSFFAKETGD